MKKLIISLAIVLTLSVSMLGLTACGDSNKGNLEKVTVTDSDGKEVTAVVNPKSVAIYDYSILDILHSVGFEKTGIEKLVTPDKNGLPSELSYYTNSDKVTSGGSLFFVDHDVLAIAEPDLIIYGARSFGIKSSASDAKSLSAEEKQAYMDETREKFKVEMVKLTVNTRDSQLIKDIENNVNALSKIFPDIKTELEAKLASIKAGFEGVKEKAKDKTAIFVQVTNSVMSIYGEKSRFDMVFEEFGFKAPTQKVPESNDPAHGSQISAEYVADVNPDVVFVLDRGATVGGDASFDVVKSNSLIAGTTAGQNNHIINLSGNAWYTMTGGFTSAQKMIEDINKVFA